MSSTATRHFRWYDYVFSSMQQCLNVVAGTSTHSTRPNPSDNIAEDPTLSSNIKKRSASLMRVNHCGEVCAQALYLGQSMTARDPALRESLSQAAQEEIDHLQWCQQRLQELNSHTSYLNPLWFTGSLLIGTIAGCFGDRWSLGFLAETEHQVYAHLEKHLDILPSEDQKSRAIVKQMQAEEAQHAQTATELGAAELPQPIKASMRFLAKMMTTIAHYI